MHIFVQMASVFIDNSVHSRYYSSKMSGSISVLDGSIDRYNGITIDTNNEEFNSDQFGEQLKSEGESISIRIETNCTLLLFAESLTHWTANSFKTIWFKVATRHSSIVPILAEVCPTTSIPSLNFDFHFFDFGDFRTGLTTIMPKRAL